MVRELIAAAVLMGTVTADAALAQDNTAADTEEVVAEGSADGTAGIAVAAREEDLILDALAPLEVETYACLFTAGVVLVGINPDGSEAYGTLAGGEVTRRGERVAISLGADFLQIDDANSVFVSSGSISEGVCSSASAEVGSLIAVALGSEDGFDAVALRETLVVRLRSAVTELEARSRSNQALSLRLAEARMEGERLLGQIEAAHAGWP